MASVKRLRHLVGDISLDYISQPSSCTGGTCWAVDADSRVAWGSPGHGARYPGRSDTLPAGDILVWLLHFFSGYYVFPSFGRKRNAGPFSRLF